MTPVTPNPGAPEEASAITVGRRELLKALAAGGGAIAVGILPDRWIEPVVEAGALPAHAQVSAVQPLTASADPLSGTLCWVTNITATISPPVAGVMIHVTVSGTGAVAPPDAATNSSGVASFDDVAAAGPGVFSLIFSFVDPAYGSDTATLGPYQQGAC
jgi:hypothetical protein